MNTKTARKSLSFALVALLSASSAFAAAPVSAQAKAGLAWPNGDTVSMPQFAGSGKVSWYYTWIGDPIRFDDGLEFVPLLWGDDDSVKNWDKSIKNLFKNKKNTAAVMGMNEPDHEGQAAMTPEQGAQIWKDKIKPLKESHGVRLGSPGPTGAPTGKQWLLDWQAVCGSDCDFDFLVLHHYGWNATHLINYVTDMHDTFQKPVWVTEWACHDFSTEFTRTCSAEEVSSYLNATQSWMDAQDWVERYAWFGAMKDLRNVNPRNALMDSNGAINDLGLQYINWTESERPDSSLPRGANANRPPNSASSLQMISSVSLGALSFAMAFAGMCL